MLAEAGQGSLIYMISSARAVLPVPWSKSWTPPKTEIPHFSVFRLSELYSELFSKCFFLFCITTALIPSTFIARCQKHPATHHASTHQAAACRPLPAPINEEVTLVKQPSSSAAAQHRGRRTQCHGWAAFSLSAHLVRTSAHVHQLKAFPGTGPRDF